MQIQIVLIMLVFFFITLRLVYLIRWRILVIILFLNIFFLLFFSFFITFIFIFCWISEDFVRIRCICFGNLFFLCLIEGWYQDHQFILYLNASGHGYFYRNQTQHLYSYQQLNPFHFASLTNFCNYDYNRFRYWT